MRTRPTIRRSRRQRGAALLLVLWVFMLLGVLAFDFGQYMRDDAMAAVNMAEETRGYYLAVGGINRGIYDQVVRDAYDGTGGEAGAALEPDALAGLLPIDGQWHRLTLLGGEVEVRMTDEGARIPLGVQLDPSEEDGANAEALRVLLTAVVTNLMRLGGQPGCDNPRDEIKCSQTVVNSILDWLDPDDEVRIDGAEEKYYAGLDPPRLPKNGVLDSPEELLLVRGVNADLFYGAVDRPGMRDLVSVFNPSVAVGVRRADVGLLQALFGIDTEEAAEAIAERDGQVDGADLYLERIAGLAQSGNLGLQVDQEGMVTPAFGDESDEAEVEAETVVLIEARADVAAARNQSRVAAVVLLNDLDCELSYCRSLVSEGVTVLRWYDRGPWSSDDLEVTPSAGEEPLG